MTPLPPDSDSAAGADGASDARPPRPPPPSSPVVPSNSAAGFDPLPDPAALPSAAPLLWPRRRELLTPAGAALIASLIGTGVALNRTARRFPHIVNRLAAVRHLPAERARLFDSLFFTTRPRRQGLPPRVLAELLAFRAWVDRRAR